MSDQFRKDLQAAFDQYQEGTKQAVTTEVDRMKAAGMDDMDAVQVTAIRLVKFFQEVQGE